MQRATPQCVTMKAGLAVALAMVASGMADASSKDDRAKGTPGVDKVAQPMASQRLSRIIAARQPSDFRLNHVTLELESRREPPVFRMLMPKSATQDPTREQLADRDFMAWLPIDFGDGVIEVEVFSQLLADAPAYARGFIGVSYRIDDAGRFESIYLRPTNSVADDQVRRNHTVQYVAFPDYRFDRLRKEAPAKYESYADVSTGRWIAMRLVVKGARTELFLDRKPTPALIVSDMKLGESQRGGVGIWLESGTLARFRNLRIVQGRAPS